MHEKSIFELRKNLSMFVYIYICRYIFMVTLIAYSVLDILI